MAALDTQRALEQELEQAKSALVVAQDAVEPATEAFKPLQHELDRLNEQRLVRHRRSRRSVRAPPAATA